MGGITQVQKFVCLPVSVAALQYHLQPRLLPLRGQVCLATMFLRTGLLRVCPMRCCFFPGPTLVLPGQPEENSPSKSLRPPLSVPLPSGPRSSLYTGFLGEVGRGQNDCSRPGLGIKELIRKFAQLSQPCALLSAGTAGTCLLGLTAMYGCPHTLVCFRRPWMLCPLSRHNYYLCPLKCPSLNNTP